MSLQAQFESAGTPAPDALADAPVVETVRPVPSTAGLLTAILTPKYAGVARPIRIRWALHGAADAPVLIVQGGISADRHAALAPDGGAGWWASQIGVGKAIDPNHWRVLSIDWLDLDDLGDALAVGSEDQADAIAAVLDLLGIERARAFIGASYGAMVGLAFAARHPRRLERLVAIAGAHRAHPLAIAIRNVQREIVRLGERLGDARAGLELARRLAMTTYRGEREFDERCGAAPVHDGIRFRFAEEAWLRAAGVRFAARVGAARFLALSESIDLHALPPESVRVPVTLVGIVGDRVVPLADLCELQRRCGAPTQLHVIDSRHGHDAFLKELAAIAAVLRACLTLPL